MLSELPQGLAGRGRVHVKVEVDRETEKDEKVDMMGRKKFLSKENNFRQISMRSTMSLFSD